MLRHSDTSRQASEYMRNENDAMQHLIELAKSDLLITLPEIAGGRNTMTVINNGADRIEPIFTREVA